MNIHKLLCALTLCGAAGLQGCNESIQVEITSHQASFAATPSDDPEQIQFTQTKEHRKQTERVQIKGNNETNQRESFRNPNASRDGWSHIRLSPSAEDVTQVMIRISRYETIEIDQISVPLKIEFLGVGSMAPATWQDLANGETVTIQMSRASRTRLKQNLADAYQVTLDKVVEQWPLKYPRKRPINLKLVSLSLKGPLTIQASRQSAEVEFIRQAMQIQATTLQTK